MRIDGWLAQLPAAPKKTKAQIHGKNTFSFQEDKGSNQCKELLFNCDHGRRPKLRHHLIIKPEVTHEEGEGLKLSGFPAYLA